MSRTSVTSRDLAVFLSEQLGSELEAVGYRTSAEGPDVVLTGPDGTETRNGIAGILDDAADPRGVDEKAATAARAVLSHIQDAVTRSTGQPWPDAQRGRSLPDAEVTHGTLLAWFGDAHAPVWRSAELPLER